MADIPLVQEAPEQEKKRNEGFCIRIIRREYVRTRKDLQPKMTQVEDYTIPLKLKANQASGAIITTIHTAYNFSESNAPFFDNKFPDFFP